MYFLSGRSLSARIIAHAFMVAIVISSFADLAVAQKRVAPATDPSDRGGFTSADSTSTFTGCQAGQINTTGGSDSSGTMGNIRTFSSGSFSVKASAFSRRKSDGLWQTAFLGAFGSGLGVTDAGEGTGGNDTHRVDNVGDRLNYVLLEFDKPVILDQLYLDNVVTDSDVSVWIGNTSDPYNNHLTLSDALLSGFGSPEENLAADAASRWANVNSSSVVGNVAVVAASVSDTSPEDWFKLRTLDINCAPPSASVTIIKKVMGLGGATASTTPFTFDATRLGVASFSLVDNNVFGPDRLVKNVFSFGAANAITVTEPITPGWTLSDIDCDETGTQNSTTNIITGSANIIAESGESIVCTFTNAQLNPSAASVSVSGQARSASRGIGGAVITLQNGDTGETRTATTNQFGFYSFDDVEVGKFYVMTIRHKRYVFTNASLAFTLDDNLTGMDFVQAF